MKHKKTNKKKKISVLEIAIFLLIVILSSFYLKEEADLDSNLDVAPAISYNLGDIPEYNGSPYVTINNNIPNFDETDYTTESFEKYSKLDRLGRCGVAYANVCREIMPPKRRHTRGY